MAMNRRRKIGGKRMPSKKRLYDVDLVKVKDIQTVDVEAGTKEEAARKAVNKVSGGRRPTVQNTPVILKVTEFPKARDL